jgi:hypothetical protein
MRLEVPLFGSVSDTLTICQVTFVLHLLVPSPMKQGATFLPTMQTNDPLVTFPFFSLPTLCVIDISLHAAHRRGLHHLHPLTYQPELSPERIQAV